MYRRPAPARPAPALTFEQLLERVQYEGAYPNRERAERAVRDVLAALGRRLTGDERVELASRLPAPAALAFTAEIPDIRQLTGWEFVKDLAARCGGTLATARWDTGAVLGPVADLAGPELVERILAGLPDGYALLFGQAQLRPPRAAA
ncbi:DUF2267 domain-containing protein [Streptomyces sp. NPDC003042]